MELFWYIILIAMLTIYIILDGYDFGAGIIHLFFAKNEKDKKIIKSAIGPFWDANEVWLIAAGGVLFFAFPTLYAVSFSGFYLPLIMILWLLIFRAISLELRTQVNNHLWHNIFDVAFGVSNLLLALFFCLTLGNILRGVNLGGIVDGVSKFEPHYFFLPLWNSTLNPLAEHLGIIDWFTIFLGLISLVSLTIHGAMWIIFKTNSSINEKLKDVIIKLSLVLSILLLIVLIIWGNFKQEPFQNFANYPFLITFPILTLVGIFGIFRIKKYKNHFTGFLFSSIFLIGSFISGVVAIFPNFLPSTNNLNPSLNIYNMATDKYGLQIGIYWWILAIILVGIYFFFQYKKFSGKMDSIEYGEH